MRDSDLGSMGKSRTKGKSQWSSEEGEASYNWDSKAMAFNLGREG